MASSSSKKTASSNAATLRELHLISLVINMLALLVLFVFHRPGSKWKYFVFSAPAFACQFVLEKSGRPTFTLDNATGHKKLLRSGDDIKGPGLFEYMFDCIYITWICDVLMIVLGSNKVWLLYLSVPAFIIYKISSLAKALLGNKSPSDQAGATSEVTKEPTKSKRQAKLEKRNNTQKVRLR